MRDRITLAPTLGSVFTFISAFGRSGWWRIFLSCVLLAGLFLKTALAASPCAAFPNNFVPFTKIYYVSQPNKAGDQLVVGLLGDSFDERASKLTVISNLALPASDNQQYCGRVELGPNLLAVAYVPTVAERNGNFGDFSGLLIDPLADLPFPGGIIPRSRFGDPFAWRIAPDLKQGPAWAEKSPASRPSPRYSHSMAFDGARGRVVLFGGNAGPDNSYASLGDTWLWDGNQWLQQSPATSPAPRNDHAMAHDAGRGQTLLFGGLNSQYPTMDDTWIWDGATWLQQRPATSPNARTGHSMVYDAARGEVVLFGGHDRRGFLNDTWVWNGATWSYKAPPAQPPPRVHAAMAYDSVHRQVILFGGYDGQNILADTWVWDGAGWTQEQPATAPPRVAAAGLAADPLSGYLVLFGGSDERSQPTDTSWLWNGTTWTRAFPAVRPLSRSGHIMVSDNLRQQIVLFGGGPYYGAFDDSWIWGSTADGGGSISVTTTLAAATFTISGPATYTGSGISFNQPNASVGTYTISYGSVPGYTTPASQTMTLSAGSSISFVGAYTQSGTGAISVSTNVPGATFDIEPGHYVGIGPHFTKPNVQAGSYTISYSSFAGCTTTPPDEIKQVAAGNTTTFIGTYQGCAGTIQIDSNIPNATFSITPTLGQPIRGGGPYPIMFRNMPFDTYTVAFDAIVGYNTPVLPPKPITIGSITTFAGNYTVNGTAGLGRIQIATNQDSASFSVIAVSNTIFDPLIRDGRSYDTGFTVPAGTYQISFAPLPGYFTPSDQTLTVTPGSTVQFTGTYQRIIVVLFTGFSDHPDPIISFDGSTYPDSCSTTCPGMLRLATELRNETRLQKGVLAKTFTYYDSVDYHNDLFPWYQVPSDPTQHQVAAGWLQGTAKPGVDDKIVVIGHSYGGNRARLFAEQLPGLGYSASLLVTVDPIDFSICTGLLTGLSGACNQDDDAYAKTKHVSITDVLAFSQLDSTEIRGYHFSLFPYTRTGNYGCAPREAFCSHMAISEDPVVHTAILDRFVTLIGR